MMKNLKKFNQLNEQQYDTFYMAVDQANQSLNLFYLLMDEGYFDDNGNPKYSIKKCNDFAKNQTGRYEMFKDDDDLKNYKHKVKKDLEKLIAKIK